MNGKITPAEWLKAIAQGREPSGTAVSIARDKITDWTHQAGVMYEVVKDDFELTLNTGGCFIRIGDDTVVCNGKTLAILVELGEATFDEIESSKVSLCPEEEHPKENIPCAWTELAEGMKKAALKWWQDMAPVITKMDREARALWAPIPIAKR